ncbi:hypothetical protein TNCV_505701 [Trichonephila clavipes]|nr:hypothetical protein TNCV_505701 [Trichonephila clavipes]
MKAAGWSRGECCWPGGSFGCAVRNVGSSGHEKVPRAENRVWSDQEDRRREDRRICGKHLWTHSDSFNDTSSDM